MKTFFVIIPTIVYPCRRFVSYAYDVVIFGGGIVGLTIAYQLLKRGITNSILLIDKELSLGKHTSGRNSGVLHAGIYYQPGSLKASLCISGARRLKAWIHDRKLPINHCGKIIVPTNTSLDSQIDFLSDRASQNGVMTEVWNEDQLESFASGVRSASGRCLWSPSTSVTSPKHVMSALQSELSSTVDFALGEGDVDIDPVSKCICLSDDVKRGYGHLINCAGINSLSIAKKFGVGLNFKVLPFKGLYWKLKVPGSFHIPCNIYPVPDLSVPFLGIHLTPSASAPFEISIGPTATPVFGKENYRGLDDINFSFSVEYYAILLRQFISNKNKFRRYVSEQSLLHIGPLLIREVQKLYPSIKSTDIELSNKVGIRPQLYDSTNGSLFDDFNCVTVNSSTHLLNAVSPAFTASFSLADYIIDSIPS